LRCSRLILKFLCTELFDAHQIVDFNSFYVLSKYGLIDSVHGLMECC
jgi:hypothetical protein